MAEQILKTEQKTPTTAIRTLYERLQGNVITTGDSEYDQARKVWNGAIDRHPALIARPSNTAGVVQAVNYAREQGLPLAIRCGGHGMAGFGTVEGGLVIDMSLMKGIEIDPAARTAKVQGGVLGKELGAAAGPHGLALPLGTAPTTGVTGVLLGGGIGWLTRKYGLTLDNLLSAEVVAADGQVLRASETENPDLFWALRGGGGNFGVVTEMEVRLQPAGIILGGLLLYPIDRAAEMLRAYRDFTTTASDAMGSSVMFMTVPPIPVVPAALHGQQVMAIGICYAGDPGEGQATLSSLRAAGEPLLDMIAPMPFGVLQGMGEGAGERGFQHDVRAEHLSELSDTAIDTIARYVLQMPGSLCQAQVIHLGGAMSRVPSDATAFPHRKANFLFAVLPGWTDPASADVHRAWMLDFDRYMKLFACSGVYVNFLSDEGPDRVRAAYGENFERLVELKRKYDPANLFRLNQNIAPDA